MNDREKDDQQTDRMLSRREVIGILGGVAGTGIFGSAPVSSGIPGCVGRPQQTQGPYYLETQLIRSDIRSDPSNGSIVEGVPLILEFRVSRVSEQGCAPLEDAIVDVWHCDANGFYSGVKDPGFDTTGKKFLRGYQITDRAGVARFLTIYPGWYQGRTVHMHFKIRTGATGRPGFEFTSQLYFDDSVTDQVYTRSPYNGRPRRTMRNQEDGLFRAGGDKLTLELVPKGSGYSAVFEIGLT